MDFGRLIDALIEPFSPRSVRRRVAERMALNEMRLYDAAGNNRRTQGWRRSNTSANAEIKRGLVGLRNGSRELVRNNKYAGTALRQLTAHVVGDGITSTMLHPDPKVQLVAQKAWDDWCGSKVDGRNDFYGAQKLAVRAWFEGGESLLVYRSKNGGYSNRLRVVEGDLIDHQKNVETLSDGGSIVQGVEFDGDGERVAVWLFDRHPGELGLIGSSKRWTMEHISHVFEELRPGQARGVPLLAALMLDMKDTGDYEDAVMMKKKVEACLALILSPDSDANPVELGGERKASSTGPQIETLRPGMILRTNAGDQAQVVNPSSTGDSVEFMVKRLAALSASTVPYHILTGDVSQANYSSTRAAMLAFWQLLDDWQQNVAIPYICQPTVERRMRELYLKTGDRRFLEVKAQHATPVRRFLDPLKDVAGEVAEVRAGFKLHGKSLSERGMTVSAYAEQRKAENQIFDDAGLVVETDPRKVTDSGILQAPTGYIAPKGGNKQEQPHAA